MSHQLDQTTGINAMAYAAGSATPWHGLGQQIPLGATAEEIGELAGIGFDVLRAPVKFDVPTFAMVDGKPAIEQVTHSMKERVVLYRSDTHAPLSTVSTAGYKVVQPKEILGAITKLSALGGFAIETAGALSDGKRIWALAKAGEGVNVIGADRVAPYILFATSFDGTMATVAQFSAIRVVCNNTIRIALSSTDRGVDKHVSKVSIPHSTTFDADKVLKELGLVKGAFGQFMDEARHLAGRGISVAKARDIAAHLFLDVAGLETDDAGMLKLDKVSKNKNFLRVMELAAGAAIGSDLAGIGNGWAMLNAVTQIVDHEMGRSRNTGLTSAWFGAGDNLKVRAKDLLLAA